ncbi:MAG: type II secretion system protein GspG [Planctomycetota bacterium]
MPTEVIRAESAERSSAALGAADFGAFGGKKKEPTTSYPDGAGDICPLDAWGRSFRVRVPGPIHRSGWDLYSLGANGMDEQGDGDDLIVGETVHGEAR